MNLLRRGVTSSAYNIAANVVSLLVSLVGSIILARLLAPEVFGVYAFVTSTVQLTAALPNFGFQPAFLHRTGEGAESKEEILRVFFTLKLLFSLGWAVLVGAGAALLAPEPMRWVFGVILATTFVTQQLTVVTMLLTQQVQFGRLAIARAAAAVTATLVSVGLAWRGCGLWALLGGLITSVVIKIVLLYVIRPVWRPRLGWSKELVRYFIGFGSKVFGTALLAQALDRIDDIWTGAALGDRALGFYDKAYSFATYPRQVLSAPVTQVVAGMYAQLRNDRPRLSQAFSWANILMARANFGVAALMWLIAPEFIRLALGARWLPMLNTFRLMPIYTLFDPIKGMIATVLIISGAPERVIRARIIQLGVMIAGLAALGSWMGIAGVALAVDAMLVVGIAILYTEARRFVDFSLKRIFGMPTLALGLGTAAAYVALWASGIREHDWLTGLIKGTAFSLTYAGVLAAAERKQMIEISISIWKPFRNTIRRDTRTS